MNSAKEIDALAKEAQEFGLGDRTFKLGNGQTLSHVVKAWNSANPARKINLKALISANGGLDPKKYVSGKTYKMPSSAYDRNNPGNVRFYGQNWLGEIADGLSNGDFSAFDTPEHGARAAVRTTMNIARKLPSPTIEEIMRIYSPTNENNTARHAASISRISGIPKARALRQGDVGQWVDFARGLFQAETGKKYSFSPSQMTNVVESAMTSK